MPAALPCDSSDSAFSFAGASMMDGGGDGASPFSGPLSPTGASRLPDASAALPRKAAAIGDEAPDTHMTDAHPAPLDGAHSHEPHEERALLIKSLPTAAAVPPEAPVAVPPPTAESHDSSAAAVSSHSTSPTFSAEPSSSTHPSSPPSSAGDAASMSYRGLQVSVQHHATSSASASGSFSDSSDDEQVSSLCSNTETGPDRAEQTDAMQLATPHAVPSCTTAAPPQPVESTPSVGGMATGSQPHEEAAGNGITTQPQEPPTQTTTPAAAMKDCESAAEGESVGGSASSSSASPAVAASSAYGPVSAKLTMEERAKMQSGVTNGQRWLRFEPVRTLQKSLFGEVQLAKDTLRGIKVAAKISHARFFPPAEGSASSKSVETARSQAGVPVLEDPRREARILRLVVGSDLPPLGIDAIDASTCGLSNALINAMNDPEHAEPAPMSLKPSIRQQFLDSISKGKKVIMSFYEEVDGKEFHCIVAEYISAGDMFNVLTREPDNKVSEERARAWFYSLCCSIRYLHAQSIAHLDLSLENVCVDKMGHVRLIDFGLASQHPQYNGSKRSKLADGSVARNCSAHIRLLNESGASNSCDCKSCKATTQELLENDEAIQYARRHHYPPNKFQFLCRPVCEKVHKPGKLAYLPPELYSNSCWDAYATDIFAMGVILYSILTGRPPFGRAEESDPWFRAIYSGSWLSQQVRQQSAASVFTCLSPNALDLINRMIKPQHMRPTIDMLMRHPWMNAQHPGSVVPPRNLSSMMRSKDPRAISRVSTG